MLSLVAAVACSNADKRADIPRRTAYRHVDLPEHGHGVISDAETGQAIFLIEGNGDFDFKNRGDDRWVTVEYPLVINAVYYGTDRKNLSKEELQQAAANRMERFLLNAGTSRVHVKEIHSGDSVEGAVVYGLESPTPLQFFVMKPRKGRINTGVFRIEGLNAATYDSLRPVVDYLREDMDAFIYFFINE